MRQSNNEGQRQSFGSFSDENPQHSAPSFSVRQHHQSSLVNQSSFGNQSANQSGVVNQSNNVNQSSIVNRLPSVSSSSQPLGSITPFSGPLVLTQSMASPPQQSVVLNTFNEGNKQSQSQYNIGQLGMMAPQSKEEYAREMINVFNQPSDLQKQTLKQLKPFYGKVFKVMKLAESSVGYNQRMMGVRANGMLVYYSQVVDDVKTGKIDRILIPPKAGVMVEQIKSLKMEYNISGKLDMIVTFTKNNMFTFRRNPNGVIEYPNQSKEVSWTFIVESTIQEDEVLKKRAELSQKRDMQQQRQEEKDQQAIMERLQRDQEEKARRMQEMSKEMRDKEIQQKEEEERRTREKEKEELLMREQLNQQEENRRKKEQEDKLRNTKKSKIENAWEYRLYMIVDELVRYGGENFENTIRCGLKLFQLVGSFREKCVGTIKDLVDDLALLETHKKYVQVDTRDIRYSMKESEEMIYFINGVLVRVSNTEFIAETKKQFYDSRKSQLINHEFRAYELLSDILLMFRKSTDCPLKVPLTCSIEYRGYKCLCMADIPITEGCMVVGAMPNGAYIQHTPLLKDLASISQVLNLKPYRLPINRGMQDIYLSIFSEVYRPKPEMWDDVRKLINENSELWEELHTVIRKQKDRLDKLEGGTESKFYDPDLAQEITQRFKEQYYIVKLGGIFPVQVDINKNQFSYYSNRLRPELVTEHCPEPLSSGAFLSPVSSAEQDQDDIKVAQAGQMLMNEVVPQLVSSLDRLTIVPVDSPTLTRIFHEGGVNMRFLGRLAQLSSLPHLKEIAIIEMIARTLKKVINHHWVEFAITHFREGHPELFRQQSYQGQSFLQQAAKEDFVQDFSGQINQECAEIAIDFLNLVFGSSPDTKTFWDGIVRPQVQSNYNYDVGAFPVEVTPGGLMHAVLYHCRIKITYTNAIKFYTTPTPFSVSQFVSLAPHSKVYSFKSTEIRMIADKFKDYRTNMKTLDLALKSLNLKISLEKALRNPNNMPHAPLPEAILFSDMGEIHLQLAELQSGSSRDLELEQAIAKARIALELIPPFHAEAVKPLCVLLKAYYKKPQQQDMALEYFDQAITILEFHVGPYHPLHASLYSIMSQCYLLKKRYQDSLILLKSALICCTRILGNNHSMTAEVYMDMAHVYMKMSDLPETIKVLEKALVINEAERGEMSPECGKLNLNISGLYAQIGKFDRSLAFSKIALNIFEPHDVSFSQELLEATYMSAKSCDSLGDDSGKLFYAEKMYFILEKYLLKKYDYYEYSIKQVMISMIDEQSSEFKNVMYKLMIALSSNPDELQLEDVEVNQNIVVRSASLVQYEPTGPGQQRVTGMAAKSMDRFQPPIEDRDERVQVLNELIVAIRPAKSTDFVNTQAIQNFFKSMFYCIDGRSSELLYERDLYNNLDAYLQRTGDATFRQYVVVFANLIGVYGETAFYHQLKQSFKFMKNL